MAQSSPGNLSVGPKSAQELVLPLPPSLPDRWTPVSAQQYNAGWRTWMIQSQGILDQAITVLRKAISQGTSVAGETGPAGPAGATGPQGPAGPQGPTGAPGDIGLALAFLGGDAPRQDDSLAAFTL